MVSDDEVWAKVKLLRKKRREQLRRENGILTRCIRFILRKQKSEQESLDASRRHPPSTTQISSLSIDEQREIREPTMEAVATSLPISDTESSDTGTDSSKPGSALQSPQQSLDSLEGKSSSITTEKREDCDVMMQPSVAAGPQTDSPTSEKHDDADVTDRGGHSQGLAAERMAPLTGIEAQKAKGDEEAGNCATIENQDGQESELYSMEISEYGLDCSPIIDV